MRALGSLQRQSFQNFEVIIVDDGSTDDTLETLDGYAAMPIRVLAQANGGPGKARNTGARVASGRFLTFLDSDDEAVQEWLESYRDDLVRYGEAVVSCSTVVVNEVTGEERSSNLLGIASPEFGRLRGVFAHGGTYCLPLSLFRLLGGFDERLRNLEHTEFALRLGRFTTATGFPCRMVHKGLIRRTLHRGACASQQNAEMIESVEYLLTRHADLLRRSPESRAGHLSVAGVRSLQLGRLNQARSFFLRALLARPGQLKSWLRLLSCTLPGPAVRWLWNHRPEGRMERG